MFLQQFRELWAHALWHHLLPEKGEVICECTTCMETQKKKSFYVDFGFCVFAAMVTRRCFPARVSSWQWAGSGTKGCGTSLCSFHCGGKNSRDPRHSLQVKLSSCAEVATVSFFLHGGSVKDSATNCANSVHIYSFKASLKSDLTHVMMYQNAAPADL